MKLTLSAFVFPLAIKSTFIPPITTCNRIVIACTVMYDCLIFTNLEFEKNMCLYSQYWNLNWMEILTLLEKFDVLILCHSSALTEHKLFDCQLLRCYEWEQCLETEHVKDTLVLIHCRPKVSNSNIVMPVNHLRTLSLFSPKCLIQSCLLHNFLMSQTFERILAWRDFPWVRAMTFWRMNGVTSFPITPSALEISKREQKMMLILISVILISDFRIRGASGIVKWPHFKSKVGSWEKIENRFSVPCLCHCNFYSIFNLLSRCCVLLWDGHS